MKPRSPNHSSDIHDDAPASPSRREVLRLAGAGIAAPTLLAGCWGNSSSGEVTYADTIAKSKADIQQALIDSNTSAISVALIDGETIVWSEAFGYVDKAAKTVPDTKTMFAIGSVSKVIAAIATMILVDRRLIDLDAPLTRYVTDFRMASEGYASITVRMLLSHASGFPGTESRSIFTTTPVTTYATETQQTLATARLKHEPGEMAVYCNDGFTMIEPLIAAVAGKSYTRFVTDEILTPLSMTRSRFATELFTAGSFAPAYNGDTKLAQECVNAYASGGLYSTPSDMARLAMMLMNGGQLGGKRILSEMAVAEMGRDQTTALLFNPVPTYRFGLGWDTIAQPGLAAVNIATWSKNGGTTYYGSEFFVAPTQRLAVMLTGTTQRYGSQRLAELILLRALAERKTISKVPTPLANTPLATRSVNDDELKAIAGVYDCYDQLVRVVAESSRTLTLYNYVDDQWKSIAVGLKPRSDGTWSNDANALTSYRLLAASGRSYLVKRTAPGYGHYLAELPYTQRVEPGGSLSTAWRNRLDAPWLVVNDNAHATVINCATNLVEVKELPGYLMTASGQVVDPSASDAAALEFLKIPQVNGRDLYDVVVEKRQGQDWIWIGSLLFRPSGPVPTLSAGTYSIIIDSDGFAQWRKLPISGKVAVSGGTVWVLYDDQFNELARGEGSGSGVLPGQGKPCWLLLFGKALNAITVTLS